MNANEECFQAEQSVPQMPVSNLPSAQSTGSSPGAVSVSQPVVLDPERKTLIQQQLILLLHAHKCQRRENQSNGEMRQYSLPHCQTMKQMLSHMTGCSAGKTCPVPHCSSSRQIIAHWKNCSGYDCPVCEPLKQASDRQQQAVNDHAQCTPQIMNPIQNQQTAQTPLSQVQLCMSQVQFSTILQNRAAGTMADQSAQNFLRTNNIQSKVKAGNVALINAPPVVPGGLPDIPATVKDWHQSVSQDLRHHLVQKIVQAIFPSSDISTLQDPRMYNLFAYARKVEGDMYVAANSREEYYQLLSEKIYKIQKELEEKRQKRKEMQLQQMQQVCRGLASVIGNNSGTQSSTSGKSSCSEEMEVNSEVKSVCGSENCELENNFEDLTLQTGNPSEVSGSDNSESESDFEYVTLETGNPLEGDIQNPQQRCIVM